MPSADDVGVGDPHHTATVISAVDLAAMSVDEFLLIADTLSDDQVIAKRNQIHSAQARKAALEFRWLTS